MVTGLSVIDIVIVLGSVFLIAIVGIVKGRQRSDTVGGYFLAGNKMPWWLIGTGFVATGISSEQLVGTIGVTYKHGLAIANWEWFLVPMYVLPLLHIKFWQHTDRADLREMHMSKACGGADAR